MKIKNNILLFAFILAVIIIVAVVNIPLSKRVIPSKFVVGDHMGFDLTPGRLNFGKVVPGYGASRYISIKNNYDRAILINIRSSGEISKNLIVSENNFILGPLESKNISFLIHTNRSIKFGNYSGNVTIVSKISL